MAKLQKTLRYLLGGQLDFENLRARSIKADNIEVGTITADEIAADTITADKMNVDELSAITANLGHIIAGLIESVQIFGSYIATSTSYPRAEMSSTSDLIGAYSTANRYVKVEANPNLLGAPMANFGFDGTETWLTQVGSTFFLYSPSGVINIGPLRTVFNGAVRLGGTQDLRFSSVPGASDPDEAVTSINVLIAYLSAMGILP